MFKFVHKKHMHKDRPEARFVIYYSVSDIVLGLLLIILVGFFVVSYLQDHMDLSAVQCPAASYRIPFKSVR